MLSHKPGFFFLKLRCFQSFLCYFLQKIAEWDVHNLPQRNNTTIALLLSRAFPAGVQALCCPCSSQNESVRAQESPSLVFVLTSGVSDGTSYAFVQVPAFQKGCPGSHFLKQCSLTLSFSIPLTTLFFPKLLLAGTDAMYVFIVCLSHKNAGTIGTGILCCSLLYLVRQNQSWHIVGAQKNLVK